MSKKFELYCVKHGRVNIEIEKPPVKPLLSCPICQSILRAPIRGKGEKWQENYISGGVLA